MDPVALVFGAFHRQISFSFFYFFFPPSTFFAFFFFIFFTLRRPLTLSCPRPLPQQKQHRLRRHFGGHDG